MEGKGKIKRETGRRRQRAVVLDERTIKRGKEQGRREVAPDDELGIFVLPKHTHTRPRALPRT